MKRRRVIRKIVRVTEGFGQTLLGQCKVLLECGHHKLVKDSVAYGESQRAVCDTCSSLAQLKDREDLDK